METRIDPFLERINELLDYVQGHIVADDRRQAIDIINQIQQEIAVKQGYA